MVLRPMQISSSHLNFFKGKQFTKCRLYEVQANERRNLRLLLDSHRRAEIKNLQKKHMDLVWQ